MQHKQNKNNSMMAFHQKTLFIDKLSQLCHDAEKKRSIVSKKSVLHIWSQHAHDEMELFDNKGNSFLSYGDVLTADTLLFIWDSAKHILGKDHAVFNSVDALDNTPLHYAAIFDLDEIFNCISFTDNTAVKWMCQHVNKNTMHSVISILIEKDKPFELECLLEKLDLSPLACDFNGIYFTWLHEALFNNSRKVAVYLASQHGQDIQGFLKSRERDESLLSLLDVVLLSDYTDERHFYIDLVLWDFEYGLRVNVVPLVHLLLHQNIEMMTQNDECLLVRCITDTLLHKAQ